RRPPRSSPAKGCQTRSMGTESAMQPEAAAGDVTRSRRGTPVLIAYGVIMASATIAVLYIIRAGSHLRARQAGSDTGPVGGGTAEHLVWKLLLASALIIVVARLVGLLFQRINQPQVVGEIVAGIILGPSVLGAIWSKG